MRNVFHVGRAFVFVPVLALVSVGCIKAPNVVVVDKKTALEQQASGTFVGLEDDLQKAGIAPRPTPFTRSQLETAGSKSATAGAFTEAEADSDSERIDALLMQRCIGEAKDGSLVETSATCKGTLDVAQMNRTLERENRNRFQIWQYLKARKPKASIEDVRKAWREVHLNMVVCGGQVQNAEGVWEAKKC